MQDLHDGRVYFPLGQLLGFGEEELLRQHRAEDPGKHVAGTGCCGVGMPGVDTINRQTGGGDVRDSSLEHDKAVQSLCKITH